MPDPLVRACNGRISGRYTQASELVQAPKTSMNWGFSGTLSTSFRAVAQYCSTNLRSRA